jgi:drug/metabolite transporter (DMT)-like permease
VTTIVLGTILFQEALSGWQLAGVALVLGGIAVATGTWRRLRPARTQLAG